MTSLGFEFDKALTRPCSLRAVFQLRLALRYWEHLLMARMDASPKRKGPQKRPLRALVSQWRDARVKIRCGLKIISQQLHGGFTDGCRNHPIDFVLAKVTAVCRAAA